MRSSRSTSRPVISQSTQTSRSEEKEDKKKKKWRDSIGEPRTSAPEIVSLRVQAVPQACRRKTQPGTRLSPGARSATVGLFMGSSNRGSLIYFCGGEGFWGE